VDFESPKKILVTPVSCGVRPELRTWIWWFLKRKRLWK